jgi:sugar lactone lactonase YvrE
LAFDNNDNLFVSDFSTNCIYEFTPSGMQSTFASGLDGADGLAFDASGNLFEADIYSDTIYKFTPGGTRSTFASGLYYPRDLAFDGNGNLFVTNCQPGYAGIYEFTPTGSRSLFANGVNNPEGLAFAPTSVPEPSTLVLLAAGALGLAAYAWRKRRRNTDQIS